ncbi:MAG TPA: hypothetical protein VMW83_10030 [Spirochaetia bacterium]|nr:hypothetical protein [Spirochaetia bacterium]
MKNVRLSLLPVVAIAALLLTGCGASVATGPPAVETAVVARGQLTNSASVSGKLAPVQYARPVYQGTGPGRPGKRGRGQHSKCRPDTPDHGLQFAGGCVESGRGGRCGGPGRRKCDRGILPKAKANYLRGQALVVQGAISQYVFDNQYKLPYQATDVAANQTAPAALQAARAGVQTEQAAYDDTILTAPFAGTITARPSTRAA